MGYGEDRRFGDEDVSSGTIEGDPLLKQSPETALGPVALDRLAYLFPSDKSDTVPGGLLIKEDKPGSVPNLVGPAVNAVELTLLRDPLETV